MGGGAGAGAAGAMPAGTGYMGGVALAVQVTMTTVEVTFLSAPLSFDRSGDADVLNPARWRLEVRSPAGAVVRIAQTVDEISPKVFQVVFDGPLDAPAIYRIFVEGITSSSGVPIDPSQTSADFLSFERFRVAPEDAGRTPAATDLQNPQTARDLAGGVLGSLSHDETGDWRNESGTPYLRKRILRRIVTALGGFFHLPSYGAAEPLKKLLKPSRLVRLQARTQAQVLLEPDVVRAQVTVTRVGTNVVRARVVAVNKDGRTEIVSQDLDLDDLAGGI